jgi:hypothetical protein
MTKSPAQKLDDIMPRIAQILLMALDPGAERGERANAIEMVWRQLKAADCDHHELVKRLTTAAALQKISDVAFERGKLEAEKNRPNLPAVFRDLEADELHRMAEFCWERIHRIPSNYRGFIQDMMETDGVGLTSKQQKFLRNLYRQVGGKI